MGAVPNKRYGVWGVACDLPAGRKCCGFLGHSANHACTRRCLKLFPGGVGAKDLEATGH